MKKELVERLVIDKYFGIYTRNGFEYILEEATDNAKIYLLDFDNVKSMNKELGYTKVNEIFKNLFSLLKQDYVIGRAFSGDEIFFHTFNLTDEIDNIKTKCDNFGLSFKYVEYYHKHGNDMNKSLERMVENFH